MTDEQTAAAAAELYASIRFSSSHSANIAAIVRALQAARTPPPGHIIDDAGVVRRVVAKSIGPVRWPADVPWVHNLRVAATEHEMEQAANAERGTL